MGIAQHPVTIMQPYHLHHLISSPLSLLAIILNLPSIVTPCTALNDQRIALALSSNQKKPLAPHTPHGRFLHITDLHPDILYKAQTSSSTRTSCHRGHGDAGHFGAPRTDCDTPIALLNATFDWIAQNLRDRIDFVVWTGDSVRHEPDPTRGAPEDRRERDEIVALNSLVAKKFNDLFNIRHDPRSRIIPVVPSLGNNDILPHNAFGGPGSRNWTQTYLHIWDRFIPASSRPDFAKGGWYSVEVIPGHLAVLSLNSLIFFNKNPDAQGCIARSGLGNKQISWLRNQLKRTRSRNVKIIVIGHVPPGGVKTARYWIDSCWQEYTLLLHEFRDTVIASLFGHANLDHFTLQDVRDALPVHRSLKRRKTPSEPRKYLKELRRAFSKLPREPDCSFASTSDDGYQYQYRITKRKGCAHRRRTYLDSIGGPYAERYAISHVAPSVVPDYFPGMRVYEYNTTHLNGRRQTTSLNGHESATSLPGPAYSPQPLSLVSYKQYFANLTRINERYERDNRTNVEYEVLYDTADDGVFGLPDLTVRSYLSLAQRLGAGHKRRKGDKRARDRVWNAFKSRAFVGAFSDEELGIGS